jgi:glycosyltransferase involved in cell wall biosynthesis
MLSKTPTISVSLVTYNHERYVAESIRSILDQKFGDFELIIVDDGSTDRTPEVIAAINDPRIVSIRQPNSGPSAATNRALKASRGRYVALMTGDDLSVPDRLEKQLAGYQTGGPRLLFSKCDFIDDAGQPHQDQHFLASAFETLPRTRAQMLRRLFDGNFINGVTCFTETRLFREIGPFDPSLYQLQDHQMWINFIKKYPIEFLPEPMIRYRIRGDGGNLSTPTTRALTSNDNDYRLILRGFFEGVPDELFREAFAAELRRPDLVSPLASACEQAMILFRSARPEVVHIGVERLQALYRNPEAAAFLAGEFGYPHMMFARFLATFDPFGRHRELGLLPSTIYADTGTGHNENEVARISTSLEPSFCQTFELSRFGSVRGLRWDPLEGRFCRVHLESAIWVDGNGNDCELDLASIQSNGNQLGPGAFDFGTIDPMVFLPIEGVVRSLTLRGRWHVATHHDTLNRLHQAMETGRQAEARAAALQEQLANTESNGVCGDVHIKRNWKMRMRRAAKHVLGPWRRLAAVLATLRPGVA